MTLPILKLHPGKVGRIGRGHPWAYSNEVKMTPELKALPLGSLVQLVGDDGRDFGAAFFNPRSLIAARRLAEPDEIVDVDFFAGRIARAVAIRDRVIGSPYYRLIHAEADGFPGLVVDRYGDTVVVQANSAGADRHLDMIVEALDRVLEPTTILLRLDSPAREQEGLGIDVRFAKGETSGMVEVQENSVHALANGAVGQKTGWFYDHRPNRAFAAQLAKDMRVLDVCSYTGAFAVQAAAGGASDVLAIDRDEGALDLATQSAALNGVTIRTQAGDMFEAMQALGDADITFDVVLADPPAFVKSSKALQSGLKGYEKLTRLAAKVVAPQGYLMIASCSQPVDMATLQQQVSRGLGKAGRRGRIIKTGGAGPDHPIHPMLPESAYLKAIFLALD